MKVFHVGDELPVLGRHAGIFLAGPTPRSTHPVETWRKEALEILKDAKFEGAVYVPETADWGWLGDYDGQVTWEWQALGIAACTLFWVPRDLETMPAFTTNVEFGACAAFVPDRVVLGFPEGAPKTRYLASIADRIEAFHGAFGSSRAPAFYKIPRATTLRECLMLAAAKANAPERR